MTHSILAPCLALAALATAQTAQAQQQASCVAATDLGDTVVYALPIAYDAARNACVNRFARDGFVARDGEAFIAGFRARQDSAWPGAFRLLKVFMAQQDPGQAGSEAEIGALIAALPEANLRPFVDGLVGQMIAREIKPDSCSKIERGLEMLSPLPTDNVAGLFTFIAEIADLKNPTICAAPAARAGK